MTVEGVSELKKLLKKIADEEIEAIGDEYQSQVRRRTPIDTGRARRGWQKRTKEIRNEVPYIRRLENGYSAQAPRGFVKQSVTATINKRKTK
jgi:L-arabinose isomerase